MVQIIEFMFMKGTGLGKMHCFMWDSAGYVKMTSMGSMCINKMKCVLSLYKYNYIEFLCREKAVYLMKYIIELWYFYDWHGVPVNPIERGRHAHN
jgi:hypothetical protein